MTVGGLRAEGELVFELRSTWDSPTFRTLRAALTHEWRRSSRLDATFVAHYEEAARSAPDMRPVHAGRRKAVRRFRRSRRQLQPGVTSPSRWLYPFSGRSGAEGTYVWRLKNGEEVPVSLEAYRRLIKSRELVTERWWLTNNYRRIKKGDFLYIYTGDEDAGIVGFATVRNVYEPFDYRRATINLNFDISLSQEMLRIHPIPAVVVRRWFHEQKRAVENITPHGPQLAGC